MKNIFFSLLACLLLAAPATSTAGSWWEKVSDIAVSANASLEGRNNTLFLYDSDHAYRSLDNGRTWEDQSSTFAHGILTIKNVGKHMYAFARTEVQHSIKVHRSEDDGLTWEQVSTLDLPQGNKLCAVTMLGTGFYATSTGNRIYTSWDLGNSWSSTKVDAYLGDLVDFAASPSVWIAVGTKGTMWSSNAGKSWHESYAPIEVGSGITQVETYDGTIYAGGHIGAAKFDDESRSWNALNVGLPTFASLVAEPMALLNEGGVLFGAFQTYDGLTSMMRLSRSSDGWVAMESAGLPPHNNARNENFVVLGNQLFFYYHSEDVGFVGVYEGTNDAPTSVEEELAAAPPFTAGPNPATSQVTVRLEAQSGATVTLVDAIGNVLDVQYVTGSEAIFDTNRYAAGMYQIRVSDGNSTTQRPIVIQR